MVWKKPVFRFGLETRPFHWKHTALNQNIQSRLFLTIYEVLLTLALFFVLPIRHVLIT